MKRNLVIIPARYASARFPGKPLADIAGKSMIERVFRQVMACNLVSEALVATDDQRIFSAVTAFGGKVVLTSDSCISGTDRCGEALSLIGGDWDTVVNVQGDEPFIRPEQIAQLITGLSGGGTDIATLVRKIDKEEDIFNPNVVKAVLSRSGNALYFSRSPIPFVRQETAVPLHESHLFYRHLGVYGFRPAVLTQLAALPPGLLESAESLEQLRWLEAGYSISASVTDWDSIGIDTPEDLVYALKRMV